MTPFKIAPFSNLRRSEFCHLRPRIRNCLSVRQSVVHRWSESEQGTENGNVGAKNGSQIAKDPLGLLLGFWTAKEPSQEPANFENDSIGKRTH